MREKSSTRNVRMYRGFDPLFFHAFFTTIFHAFFTTASFRVSRHFSRRGFWCFSSSVFKLVFHACFVATFQSLGRCLVHGKPRVDVWCVGGRWVDVWCVGGPRDDVCCTVDTWSMFSAPARLGSMLGAWVGLVSMFGARWPRVDGTRFFIDTMVRSRERP